MKANVLPVAIDALDIYEGDVIRIFGDDFSDIYRYKNGEFEYLNGSDPVQGLTDLELLELIKGGNYEILARGGNDKLTTTVERLEDTVAIIEEAVNEILDNQIKKEKLETKAREKEIVEDKAIFWSSVASCGFFLICIICQLFRLLF